MRPSFLKHKLIASTLLAGAVGHFWMGAISAQETENSPIEEEARQERVLITGSRIQRDSNLDSSIPITTVGASEILASSAFNAAEVIRQLPQAGIPGLTATTTNFSVFSAGIESVDLRNLGDSRTLVLVDSRRFVPGQPGTSIVDFSMIPPDFIEKIDVVTGGASSVYGSEAIAGVINIILKDDFEGIQANARMGETFEKGGFESRLSLTGGTAFDRGNTLFNVTYDWREGIHTRDTDYAVDVFSFSGSDVVVQPLYSSYPEQGRYIINGRTNNLTLDDNGAVVEWDRLLGFNRQENRRILAPQERWTVASKTEYAFNDWAQLSVSMLYSQVESDSDTEPFPLGSDDIYNPNGTVTGAGIPITNPLIPDGIRSEMISNGDETLEFARRMTEVSDREARYDRDAFDISIGLDGDVPGFSNLDRNYLNSFTYTTYYNYGRASSVRNNAGQVNVQNMRYALDAIEDPNNPDQVICRDATARAFGCVPINIFGAGSISEAAAAYVAAPGQRNAETEQYVLHGSVSGELFQAPAGAVGVALGLEYRDIEATDLVDALTSVGLNAGNAIESTVGGFSVNEYFGEVLVPLVNDVSFIDGIDFEGAYRYADYSTVGGNDSWKYGFVADMFNEQLKVRAVGARAARAPDIDDLFSGNAQSFLSTVDPCNGISGAAGATTGPSDTAIIDACLAIDPIATIVNNGGTFSYSDIDTQSQYYFTSGSDLLEPEISDSYTIGFVYQPNWLQGLSLSIDYVSFEIEEAITNLNRDVSATLCLQNGNTATDPFCQNIVRDTQTGKILFSYERPINAALFSTDAYDFQLRYTGDVPAVLGFEEGVLGSFDARLLWTYTDSYKYQGDDESVEVDLIGDLDYPYNSANFSLNWTRDWLTLGYRVHYLSEQIIDENNDCDQDTVDFYGALYSAADTFCYTPGSPDYLEQAVSFNVDFEDTGFEFYGGIDNLTDEFVYVPSGYRGNVTGTSTAADVFDAKGRRFYLGIRKSW